MLSKVHCKAATLILRRPYAFKAVACHKTYVAGIEFDTYAL